MCPSSPSAWQIWSWADPFPSLSKKLLYFVKNGLLQTAPKRDRRSRKGPPISFFATYSLRCRPVIDRLSPLRPLLRSASGAAGALCAKIIEACRAQDCRLSRRPEEVLNIMQNTPAKPLCKGPQAVVLPLHCLPRRSNALCHKVHFRNGKFFVIPQCPPSPNKKRPDKSRVRPEGHTLPVYLYLTMCADDRRKAPSDAETTR